MPSYQKKIEIPNRSAKEIFEKLHQAAPALVSRWSEYGFSIEPETEVLRFAVKSKLFNGKIQCTDGVCLFNASLSLIATPFRSKIDEGIEKWIQKTFHL